MKHTSPHARTVTIPEIDLSLTEWELWRGRVSTLHLLGTGRFAYTYAIDKKRVLKVAYEDDGYEAYMQRVLAYQGNKWIPKIYNVVIVNVKDENESYTTTTRFIVVMMERLKSLHVMDEDHAYGIANSVDSYFHSRCALPKTWMKRLRQNVDKELFQVHWLLQDLRNVAGARLDLHAGNIMMRGNGQLVITDPAVIN